MPHSDPATRHSPDAVGMRIANDPAACGAMVVVTGRSIETLDAASEEIIAKGGKASAVVTEMSIESDARTAAYCASKGGVELLTRSMAVDWAPKGIRVNAVAPGFVETDLTGGVTEHAMLGERLLQRTPMRRFAQVGEITGAVIYLASDASRYVTGQTMGIDGGWTAG